MKSRMIFFIITLAAASLFGTQKSLAQDFSTSVNQINLDIDASNGSEVRQSFTYTVDFSNSNLNVYNDMDMFVKLGENIVNSNGTIIDPSIVKIEPKGVAQGPAYGNFTPSTASLSLSYKPILKATSGFSEWVSRGGEKWTFQFDIVIARKDLINLENGSYPLVLDFRLDMKLYRFWLYDIWYRNNIATSSGLIYVSNFQPTFGFTVNADATLNFTSPLHYSSKVESAPNSSWVSVISKNSSYHVKVKTNNPNFQLIRNDAGYDGDITIPVDVVNIEIVDNSYGTGEKAQTLSSTTSKTIFKGKKNDQPQQLPVRYFITKDDAQKMATKTPGEYKTILIYTLEPN